MIRSQQAVRKRHVDYSAGEVRDPRLIEGLLSDLPLFRGVARPQVAAVAALSRLQSAHRGATLLKRGEPMPGVMVVAYGMVKLALRRHDGEEKVVRFLGAGEAFGEAAALQDRPSPVDFVALDNSMVVIMPPPPLLDLLGRDAAFARNLVRLLSDRFLGLLAEFEATLQHTALQRLASYLISLAETNGAPDTWIVRLPASKTAVAARLGITKETMSRLLRELADRSLIVVSRLEIEIRDRTQLAKLAD